MATEWTSPHPPRQQRLCSLGQLPFEWLRPPSRLSLRVTAMVLQCPVGDVRTFVAFSVPRTEDTIRYLALSREANDPMRVQVITHDKQHWIRENGFDAWNRHLRSMHVYGRPNIAQLTRTYFKADPANPDACYPSDGFPVLNMGEFGLDSNLDTD